VAGKDIRIGDRLIRVNGTKTENLPYFELQRLLQEVKGHAELKFTRQNTPEIGAPLITRSNTLPIQNKNNIQWHKDAIE